jgi:uncharacterized protein with HEPN domain
MRNNRDNIAYLRHIQDAAEQIFEYLSHHTPEDFIRNEWDQAAVIRNLEIIGEAANKIDKSFQESYPQIAWRTIIGLRNVLIHDYMEVDTAVVWQIIDTDLKALYEQISKILQLH